MLSLFFGNFRKSPECYKFHENPQNVTNLTKIPRMFSHFLCTLEAKYINCKLLRYENRKINILLVFIVTAPPPHPSQKNWHFLQAVIVFYKKYSFFHNYSRAKKILPYFLRFLVKKNIAHLITTFGYIFSF